MSYVHKSGAEAIEIQRIKESFQTLFQVGMPKPTKNSLKLIEGIVDMIC